MNSYLCTSQSVHVQHKFLEAVFLSVSYNYLSLTCIIIPTSVGVFCDILHLISPLVNIWIYWGFHLKTVLLFCLCVFGPVVDLDSCFFFPLVSENFRHLAKKILIWILAVVFDHWLAVALTPRAMLHQSRKTASPYLSMNVKSFRARLLERLWGNPVSRFWHLISIKHKRFLHLFRLEEKVSIMPDILIRLIWEEVYPTALGKCALGFPGLNFVTE